MDVAEIAIGASASGATGDAADWSTANQTYLGAEFARLKHRLRFGSASQFAELDQAVEEARERLQTPPAIDRLAGLFGLSEFEREVLLLCAGVEMDSELAALCAEAQGVPERQFATFGMALGLLRAPHWSALSPSAPLRNDRLIDVDLTRGLTAGALRIEERVLHDLAGVDLLEPRLEPLLTAGVAPRWMAESHQAVAEDVARSFTTEGQDAPVVNLCGDDADGQEDVATHAAELAGLRLFVLRGPDLPGSGPELDAIAQLWRREALLLSGALLLHGGGGALSPSLRRLAETLEGPLVVATREPVQLNRRVVQLRIDKPAPAEQEQLWLETLGGAAGGETARMLAQQFRLSARSIGRIASGAGEAGSQVDVCTACRSAARPRLEELARRIDCSAGWSDLVLPAAQLETLRQVAAHVRYRMLVQESWGFSGTTRRGLGVSVLFTGESGTGKTLAAEVLAHELAVDLYRVDLSSVVSKYIGESEKNLRQIFDAAEEGGVALLFDEADALFGKRTEVKDSHDHYANIQVGYLLQRLETFEGLAILTTNFKSSLDRAFHRRLRFTVNFTFPEAAQREEIWRRVFPSRTPTEGLDPRLLAQFHGTGGSIRNIALNAAFLAAQAGRPISMDLVLEATRMETQKMERPLSDSEIRGWV